MEEDVNRVSAVDMEVPRRVANQLSIEEKQKLMEYYSKQLEMMYPIASPGMTDKAGLVTLQRRNTSLIEMLTVFDVHGQMKSRLYKKQFCNIWLLRVFLKRNDYG